MKTYKHCVCNQCEKHTMTVTYNPTTGEVTCKCRNCGHRAKINTSTEGPFAIQLKGRFNRGDAGKLLGQMTGMAQ